MDRAVVWADFEQSRVLYEDADLLAVDKPVGVPSQAADADRPDDVVTRLRAYFAARGAPTYLGVHQRLDRDTSGVLVMTRRKEANAGIAAQFEGRKVQKSYRACVTGWPAGRRTATLDDTLVAGDGGRMRVASRGARGGQRARVFPMAKKNSDVMHLATPDGARNFIGQLAEDLVDKLQSIALDADDATKLERATAIVRETPSAVMAVVALSLFATVRQHEETIEAQNGLLRKLVSGRAGGAEA